MFDWIRNESLLFKKNFLVIMYRGFPRLIIEKKTVTTVPIWTPFSYHHSIAYWLLQVCTALKSWAASLQYSIWMDDRFRVEQNWWTTTKLPFNSPLPPLAECVSMYVYIHYNIIICVSCERKVEMDACYCNNQPFRISIFFSF